MTEQPSLLRAGLMSYVGLQVVLLGTLMFSIGVWFGVVWIGEAAWHHLLREATMPRHAVAPPEYLKTAGAINRWAIVAAIASLLGLIGLDYVGRNGE